jgi:hypothetical protein
MRQAKLPWLLFMLALVAIVVPIAQGTSSAKDPRVAGLVKRVTALEKHSAALQKAVDALITKSNCIGIQGVVLRGQTANEGYLYKKATDETNLYFQTAIDAPAQGETPQQLMAVIDPQCVTPGSKSFFRVGHAWTSKTSAYRGAAR